MKRTLIGICRQVLSGSPRCISIRREAVQALRDVTHRPHVHCRRAEPGRRTERDAAQRRCALARQRNDRQRRPAVALCSEPVAQKAAIHRDAFAGDVA
ncbi:hypothetical protein, partial [Xanthomonas cannabis]|uniref:hypothetical protein n=1 Tax=Xanthomonas cannabis TaxID=1885674 RepID=UPI00194E68D3